MATEQDKTLEVVQTAIQMEIDGKEFYMKASRESGNELGEKLFLSLADEEDIHRQRFVEIYDALRNKKGWPVIVLQPDTGKSPKTAAGKARRRSFKARHASNIAKGKLSAAYWANKVKW